jgi:hypothetical protein
MNYWDQFVKETTGVSVGDTITIQAKLAGIVDFGQEAQLELPDGLLIYVPAESIRRIVSE